MRIEDDKDEKRINKSLYTLMLMYDIGQIRALSKLGI